MAVGTGLWQWRPDLGAGLEFLITPVLAVLLYEMFVQIPFLYLSAAFSNRVFAVALLTANFNVVPLVVWLLKRFLPQHPPLLLRVYLVLLAPCIDYIIAFTHLGRGNARLVLASPPCSFLRRSLPGTFSHIPFPAVPARNIMF